LRLPSASLLFAPSCGENLRGEQHAGRDHPLRIGNLISTRSLSSGEPTVEDDDSAACPIFQVSDYATNQELGASVGRTFSTIECSLRRMAENSGNS